MSGVSGLLVAALLPLLTAPAAFAFFAYWAQQTRRNPWLWFFFGPLNNHRPAATAGADDGHLLSIRNDLP